MRLTNCSFRFALAAAALWITCDSRAFGGTLSISPSTGTGQVGQPFTVDVNAANLDPTNDLYDYSFDLQFDPAVFQVLAANDGTIFDYGGNTGLYFDGTIDNVNGFVTFEGGLDINGSFSGTGGLLGAFTFEALAPASGSMIEVENVQLQSFNSALVDGPADIDPGTLPVATLDTIDTTATPEPGTGVSVALGMIGGAWMLRRNARRQVRSDPS